MYFFVVLGDAAASQIVFGALILVLSAPCGYACWMRAVYNAFKKDSSFSFFFFFFSFFLEICLVVLFAIGTPGEVKFHGNLPSCRKITRNVEIVVT